MQIYVKYPGELQIIKDHANSFRLIFPGFSLLVHLFLLDDRCAAQTRPATISGSSPARLVRYASN